MVQAALTDRAAPEHRVDQHQGAEHHRDPRRGVPTEDPQAHQEVGLEVPGGPHHQGDGHGGREQREEQVLARRGVEGEQQQVEHRERRERPAERERPQHHETVEPVVGRRGGHHAAHVHPEAAIVLPVQVAAGVGESHGEHVGATGLEGDTVEVVGVHGVLDRRIGGHNAVADHQPAVEVDLRGAEVLDADGERGGGHPVGEAHAPPEPADAGPAAGGRIVRRQQRRHRRPITVIEVGIRPGGIVTGVVPPAEDDLGPVVEVPGQDDGVFGREVDGVQERRRSDHDHGPQAGDKAAPEGSVADGRPAAASTRQDRNRHGSS